MNNKVDMNKILCEVSEKGKTVVNRCLLYNYEIEPFKLQYLLILMHGTMLSMYNQPLFCQKVYAREKNLFIDEISRDLQKYDVSCNERLKENLFLTKHEEKVVSEILEKFGNTSLSTLRELRPLRMLCEVCSNKSESKSITVPNELIKEVFIYYNFYEYISPRKDENTFRRILKQEYSQK